MVTLVWKTFLNWFFTPTLHYLRFPNIFKPKLIHTLIFWLPNFLINCLALRLHGFHSIKVSAIKVHKSEVDTKNFLDQSFYQSWLWVMVAFKQTIVKRRWNRQTSNEHLLFRGPTLCRVLDSGRNLIHFCFFCCPCHVFFFFVASKANINVVTTSGRDLGTRSPSTGSVNRTVRSVWLIFKILFYLDIFCLFDC